MTDHDAPIPQSGSPRPGRWIELGASSGGIGSVPAAAPGLGVKLRISARGAHSPGEGWALWRVDGEGKATVLNHWMHQLPWGSFDWLSAPVAHDGRHLRLFASPSQLDPTRISDFVDVAIPGMPPPSEVAARDGSRRVIFTGRVLPGARVAISMDGRTVESSGEERFQLIMDDVAEGTYTYTAMTLALRDAAASTGVSGSVRVGEPPAIPLALLFPEVDRRIGRVERVTGVAAPGSELRVRVGDGAPELARANAGGAWEARRVISAHHGPVVIVAENLSTGEVVQRRVEVDYFPAWRIDRLVVGPIVDESGLVTRRGTLAEGTGDPGTVIEIGVRNGFVELATADAEGAWTYRVNDAPSLVVGGRVRLRAVGDPLERQEQVEPQGPLILHPSHGALVEGDVVVSGVSARPVTLEVDDGVTYVAEPDKVNQRWEVRLPPLPPGLHTLRARVSPHAVREVARVTIAVSAAD